MHGQDESEIEAIKIWKEQKITQCVLTFDCGGDSMGNMEWSFTDEKGDIDSPELKSYFEEAIFNKVEFYVNSDGHYQGEHGIVTITLEDDIFCYNKSAQSEYEETECFDVDIELSPEAISFIKENTSSVRQEYSGPVDITYKKDVVITDKEEALINEITEKLKKEIEEYQFTLPEDADEELYEYRYIEYIDEDLSNSILNPQITITYRKYEPSED